MLVVTYRLALSHLLLVSLIPTTHRALVRSSTVVSVADFRPSSVSPLQLSHRLHKRRLSHCYNLYLTSSICLVASSLSLLFSTVIARSPDVYLEQTHRRMRLLLL
jgi:hypothetical protein